MHEVVLTFSEFEGSAACPEDIMPKLCIVSHTGEESLAVGFMVDGVFVAVAIVVVYEASHSNFERGALGGVVDGAECYFIEGVKEDTAVEIPDGRGGPTTLTSAEDGTVVAMEIVSF